MSLRRMSPVTANYPRTSTGRLPGFARWSVAQKRDQANASGSRTPSPSVRFHCIQKWSGWTSWT